MSTRVPDFGNLLRALRRGVPDRPTLYEFFLNGRLYARLAGRPYPPAGSPLIEVYRYLLDAFRAGGYDYASVSASTMGFPQGPKQRLSSCSIDEGAMIRDRAEFEKYPWPEPESFSTEALAQVEKDLPGGMKLVVHGPGGVLENVVWICGYSNFCYLLADDPALAQDIVDAVGSRLQRYYELAAQYPAVGACMVNDDWGFKTQTMLGTADMRRYIIPWHRQIVATIHAAGLPALLHSCGNLSAVMDDVIDVIGFEAKHSYEDGIMPVEEAYRTYGRRIAVLGGIDVGFLCRASQQDIRRRVHGMLACHARGGYALGSGNSIPEYVPDEKYLAMTAGFLEAA
jgi:uroporphyrinogen decarboxylase